MPRRRQTDQHLPPCVYPKHGAYYLVKKNKWTKLGDTLGEALQAYAEKFEGPSGEVAKLIDEAIPIICNGRGKNTREQYTGAAEALKEMIGENRISQIRQSTIAQVKVQGINRPFMTNRILTVARLIFAYAVEQELMDSNPALGVKRYPEPKRKDLPAPTDFRKVYEKAVPRVQILMDLWRLTGQRVVDAMRIALVDLTDDGIEFEQAKTKARLCVAWNPELRAVVDRALALRTHAKAPTLLHGRGGKVLDYNSVAYQWRAACEAAGVKFQRRALRAVAATSAKKQGKNPTALLGHKNEAMTERYIRDRETPLVEGPQYDRVLDRP